MPRAIKLEEELTKVEQQLEVDPTYKFAVISRIVTPTYLELVKDAIDNHCVLSHQIERAVVGYYQLKDNASLNLDESAIRNLIQRAGIAVLKEEVAARNDAKATLDAALKQAKAVKGKSTPTS
jgi:hypothetical protein